MIRRRCRLEQVVVVGYLLLLSREACAYIDPGTGSFMMQIVVGLVIGAGITIKLYWRKVKNIFRRGSKEDA